METQLKMGPTCIPRIFLRVFLVIWSKWLCPPEIHMLKPTKVMVLGAGAFRSWGQSPTNEIRVLLKDTAQRLLAPSFCHGRTHRSGQSAIQRAFSRMRPCWCHSVGLPDSKTGWNKCLLFIKPPSLWLLFFFFCHSSPNGLRHLAKGKKRKLLIWIGHLSNTIERQTL